MGYTHNLKNSNNINTKSDRDLARFTTLIYNPYLFVFPDKAFNDNSFYNLITFPENPLYCKISNRIIQKQK